jgi:dihydrolipoamide dehydrogenase
MKSFDVLVIGSGPGGYIAAIRAAQLGLSTAIVEEAPTLGGVCLNWGCIPTKAILSAAEIFAAVKHGVPGLVVEGQSANYSQVIDASRAAADRLVRGVNGLMKKNKIEVLLGRGRLTATREVMVTRDGGTESVEARNVILATGSTELVLPGVQIDGKKVLTSREALESRELPAAIVIVGGGAVGLEFAYTYNAYGSQVTVIEMQDQLLPGFDKETADTLSRSFQRSGMKIMTKTAFKGVDAGGAGVVVTAENEKGAVELKADQMLLAVGRRALTADLGLESRGIALERGFIKIGRDQRTSAEGVYAIGDCSGPPLLAHKASHEGVAAAEYIAGVRKHPIDLKKIPANIYCQPQVASVGYSEAEAKAAGFEVRVGKAPFAASGKAVGTGHTEGFVKIVSDSKYGEILGAQIIGYGATELINEIALAMVVESTVTEIGETSHAHPTLGEMLMQAALAAEGRALDF